MTSHGTASNLQEAERLALALSEALSGGDAQQAVELCQRLSGLSLPVSVTIGSQAYPHKPIRLKVGVEDAQSAKCIPVTVVVSVDMTIARLKDKISHDYGFHPALQRWVIGKRLARDQETLYSHGVRCSGDQAFLFILSAQAAQLTRHQQQLDEEQQRLDSIADSVHLIPRGLTEGPVEIKAARPKLEPAALLPPPKVPPRVPPKPKPGWSCSQCTYLNKPTRPGCEMCGGECPDGYQVPETYTPDQEETERLLQEQMATLQYHQAQQEERDMNFICLLETDDMQSLVLSMCEVECPICFCTVEPGEGATLRDCLHNFCRDCLRETILNSQEAEVSCPFMGDGYSCDSKLQDREIKSLLTEEQHQRFLDLRLSIAESRLKNSFHCRTPNCPGWCIYEDEVDQFLCELCNQNNCILCKAIHRDMNCKEYQDDLQIRAQNDLAAQQTKKLLEDLVQGGMAMACPHCSVIVQKKDGCDWIRCLMCKTEICWVTKQARWGPQGQGDTSAGCRCRMNNQLCHPNCKNCH